MILVIDNYDSFTYNLVQYIGELGYEVIVKRNDEITCEEVSALNPEKIVISPGPCTPLEAGISVEIIKNIFCFFFRNQSLNHEFSQIQTLTIIDENF